MHILNLFYPLLDMAEKTLHTFEVWISVSLGSATIAAQNILAAITGQGLGAQDRWDGRITASDEFALLLLSGMQHLALSEEVEASLLTPEPTGASDQISKVLMTGMPLYELTDNLRIYAPIVHDIIDVSDKKKMTYSKIYVSDDEQFELRESYEISGGTEQDLDRGRLDSLKIATSGFESLTSLVINPFVTEPFINGLITHAKALTGTHYTKLTDESIVLQTSFNESIEGTMQEIDKGSLVVYNLGLTNFESVTELEVESG
jgi:hypothetical protein